MTDSLSPTTPSAPQPPAPRRWSCLKRLAFRFLLVYFALYTHPFPLEHVPDPRGVAAAFGQEWPFAEHTDAWFAKLSAYQAGYAALERDVVDVTASKVLGFERVLDRPAGSGDPTYSYVLMGLQLAAAAVLALVWLLLGTWWDRRNRLDLALAPWLHLLARYWLAFVLLGYGFAKVFPSQFRAPSLGRLLSPYGESSPMNVLWSFMGSSPAYTVFAGVAEVVPGLLLLFRRTALLGALLGAAVMLNVAALNYCYDVPVKLYSSHLAATALLLCVPDLGRLLGVFVANRVAPPRDLARPRTGLAGHAVRALVVLPYLVTSVRQVVTSYRAPVERPALYGIHDVVEHVEGGVVLPPLLDDPRRWRALLVETETFGSRLAMDGAPRPLGLKYDADGSTLEVSTSAPFDFALDGDTLTLRGEFARTFRSDPRAFQAPGEPRDPQVELALRRAPGWVAPTAPPPTEGAAPPGATDSPGAVAPAPMPAGLVGRFDVVKDEVIGAVANRRRNDPTGFVALEVSADGQARVEYPGGASATFQLTHEPAGDDPNRGRITLRSKDTLRVERSVDGQALTLTGTLRGHETRLVLRRRDLESFLLVRRGFHWINEVPLNRS